METADERLIQATLRLSGNPTVIDVVRIAGRLTQSEAEVVVFDDRRATVAGSLGNTLLQPRPLTVTEAALADGATGHQQAGRTTSYPIAGADGLVLGALTVTHEQDGTDHDVMHGLARICSGLLVAETADESLHTTVLEHLRDAVIVIDSAMDITYANASTAIQIGRNPRELVGRNVTEFIHPEDIEQAFDAMVRLAGGDEIYRLVVRTLHSSGDYIRLEVTGRDMTADPRVGGIILSLRNGDHDLELEGTLERTRRLSKAVVEQLHDGIIATDAVGSLLVVNKSAREVLGIDPARSLAEVRTDEIQFLDADTRVLTADQHPIRRVLAGETLLSEEMSATAGGQYRNLVVSGRPVIDADGSPIGTVVGFHDVTASRRAERELRSRALHDQLTGLANRRQLDDRLAEIALTIKSGTSVAVTGCLIDLDNFKVINDTHGHRVGDAVLRATAERISRDRDPADLVVRLGGDEFVVMFAEPTTDPVRAAEELLLRVGEPIHSAGHTLTLTASIGVATLDETTIAEGSFLRCADIALYDAKSKGRNCVQVFDDVMAEAANVAVRQREMLRSALDGNALVMQFQPLVDSDDGRLVGFESLARCRVADGTYVLPSDFLAAASTSGLVWDLDRKAFELSCQAASLLAAVHPGLTMACNFSALSIAQPDFVHFVLQTVSRHKIDPKLMCIEITENAAFEAGPIAIRALRELGEAGMPLALDDFGTGYSSLSHLRDLPLTTVKVDRSFITALHSGSAEYSIAKAVVNLAEDLGLGVVAEGVETDDELTAARSIGFNVIQGWHYSPARGLEQILDMITTQSQEGGTGVELPPEWRQES